MLKTVRSHKQQHQYGTHSANEGYLNNISSCDSYHDRAISPGMLNGSKIFNWGTKA